VRVFINSSCKKKDQIFSISEKAYVLLEFSQYCFFSVQNLLYLSSYYIIKREDDCSIKINLVVCILRTFSYPFIEFMMVSHRIYSQIRWVSNKLSIFFLLHNCPLSQSKDLEKRSSLKA